MKVLISGFDPFGGEPINPALEAVKLLPNNIAGVEVIKVEIPTVFNKSIEALESSIKN
ncbi:MAG TPA: pyroglutamyl-peptidase I, partial [Clostridium sp.]|nr:pyroglutamyl-peptidase I [Clostridium sp.]